MEPKIRLQGFNEPWDNVRIKDISNIVTGATPSTAISSYWENGCIRWMSSGELNEKYIYDVKGRITKEGYDNTGTHLLPPLCVLIGLAGQGKTRGTAAINFIELCTNQSIAAILPNEDKFDSLFLYHYIDGQYTNLRKLSTGDGGRGGLNKQLLLDFEVSLPKMAEQKAISTLLTKIDSLTSSISSRLESLKQMKEASMQAMFPQEGNLFPKVRFRGFEGDWKKVKADSIFKTFNEKNRPELPVLSATQDRGMVTRESIGYNIFHDKSNEATYKHILPGQFVIHLRSFQGGFAHSEIEGIASPAYTIMDFKDKDLYYDYFWRYVFMSKEFIKRLELITYGIRDGRSISFDEFKEMIFIVPCKEEQVKIASYLRNIDKQITLQSQHLEKLKQIKASCLEKMFV